jgi:hypothetical protein
VWALAGGAGIAAILAYVFREEIEEAAGEAIMAATGSAGLQAFLRTTGHAAAAKYADVIARVAQEETVSPFAIVALGERETGWGTRRPYRPLGDPGGTGDFTPRNPTKWKYAMPPDGLGWGRGLMQIDYGSFRSWIESKDWRDPYKNVKKGAQILKGKRDYLASRLGITGNDLLLASIAAYNAGEGTITSAWRSGGRAAIDRYTTGGDYSADVANTITTLEQQYAEQTAEEV